MKTAMRFLFWISLVTALFTPLPGQNKNLAEPLKTPHKRLVHLPWIAAAVCTAYNSLPQQTSGDPWVTASGSRCRPGVVAANFLPFGTKLQIESFGSRVFVVEDRMHRRFSDRIDIWFESYEDAIQFGKRKLRYYVIPTLAQTGDPIP